MKVSVVSPEAVLFEGDATQVATRTTDGEIAFLDGHAPFLGTLVEAETRVYLADGTIRQFALGGGFVEVSGNSVTILAV